MIARLSIVFLVVGVFLREMRDKKKRGSEFTVDVSMKQASQE